MWPHVKLSDALSWDLVFDEDVKKPKQTNKQTMKGALQGHIKLSTITSLRHWTHLASHDPPYPPLTSLGGDINLKIGYASTSFDRLTKQTWKNEILDIKRRGDQIL